MKLEGQMIVPYLQYGAPLPQIADIAPKTDTSQLLKRLDGTVRATQLMQHWLGQAKDQADAEQEVVPQPDLTLSL